MFRFIIVISSMLLIKGDVLSSVYLYSARYGDTYTHGVLYCVCHIIYGVTFAAVKITSVKMADTNDVIHT